jgi:hypothetical protein
MGLLSIIVIMQANGHQTQALKRYYKPFRHVTEGTLPTHSAFPDAQFSALCLTKLAAFAAHISRRQRLRLNLLHPSTLQPQHAMTTAGE